MMKDYAKGVAAQFTAIILAAGAAALLTFIQSVAAQSGACPTPEVSAGEAGLIGGFIKGAHAALLAMKGNIKV